MDFGDILDRWERGQYEGKLRSFRTSSSRTGSERTTQKVTRVSRSIMEEWLRNHEVYDKDANEEKRPAPGEQRRRLLRTQPDAILDIHGLTDEKAWLTLDNFFLMARDRGYKKLRIIHGKGNRSQGGAVLGRTVRVFIEQCPYAGESGYEKAANGGTGATWILIKD